MDPSRSFIIRNNKYVFQSDTLRMIRYGYCCNNKPLSSGRENFREFWKENFCRYFRKKFLIVFLNDIISVSLLQDSVNFGHQMVIKWSKITTRW